jgi:DDE superfamily endonuclease
LVKDRHRSRDSSNSSSFSTPPYPAHTAIKLILDNHSAHISKQTRAWLAGQPAHGFEFTFTPKHGSWLNLSRDSFPNSPAPSCATSVSHPGRSFKDRPMAAVNYFNQDPVVHTWTYKLDKAA